MNEMDTQPETSPDISRASLLKGGKRQHYLPRFYLEGFTGIDGCLAVYDRIKNELRRQQPINTGVSGHLYTLIDSQGRQRFEIEAALAEIESAAALHIPTLIGGGKLTVEARGAIAHFVGLLAFRTPEMIQSVQRFNGELAKRTAQISLSDPVVVAERMKRDPDHADKTASEIFDLAVDVARFAQDGEFEIDWDHQHAMTSAVEIGESVAPILFQRNWVIWEAPRGKGFVTSDAPVVLTVARPEAKNVYGLGFGSANALVITPLSGTHALAMFGDGGMTRRAAVDGRITRKLNLDIARRAQRFLLARDDAHAMSVSRAANMSNTRWKPKFSMDPPTSRRPVG